jgi:CRP/FNR family transcriptional regulator
MMKKKTVMENALSDSCPKGCIYQSNGDECKGLIVVRDGQLRAYYASDDGKEITLYRLLSGDACIMTASCTIRNINFNVNIEAEKDSTLSSCRTTFFLPSAIEHIRQSVCHRTYLGPVFRCDVDHGAGCIQRHGSADRRFSA